MKFDGMKGNKNEISRGKMNSRVGQDRIRSKLDNSVMMRDCGHGLKAKGPRGWWGVGLIPAFGNGRGRG